MALNYSKPGQITAGTEYPFITSPKQERFCDNPKCSLHGLQVPENYLVLNIGESKYAYPSGTKAEGYSLHRSMQDCSSKKVNVSFNGVQFTGRFCPTCLTVLEMIGAVDEMV